MPQPTQQSLIHVLLLWTTILSIIQLVFIILFFRPGHHAPYQNSSTVAPESTKKPPENNAPLSLSENGLLLGKGQMLTFKAVQVNTNIKWISNVPAPALISEGNESLTIKKDGYYFLNLQVALKTCKCNGTLKLEQTVSKTERKVLLQGWINKDTCSSGLLGKVEMLHAGSTLRVTLHPPGAEINDTESLTHLDIIYIRKP